MTRSDKTPEEEVVDHIVDTFEKNTEPSPNRKDVAYRKGSPAEEEPHRVHYLTSKMRHSNIHELVVEEGRKNLMTQTSGSLLASVILQR